MRAVPPRNQRFSTACILWLAVWFGVVVPGHERGQIVLPGYEAPRHCGTTSASQTASSASTPSTCCPVSRPDGDSEPDSPVQRCAICYIVATLTVPPPIDLAPQPTDRVGRVAMARPDRPVSAPAILSYHGRAPPTAA